MNRQVQVNSITALRRLQAALREYAESLQDILSSLQLESQRTVDWIQHDRASYWPGALRRADERMREAQTVLEMKQLTIDGRDKPSCTAERTAVHKARERLRYTEQKLARTREVGTLVQQHADEYRGVLSKLSQLIETDLPRAFATLDRMATALEKYASTRPANASPTTPPETTP